ncbi:MAG: 4-hydroxy-3-methylbut-2-enyl diphosphate reductase, partial [Dehalococcoidales bacterium]|nr:4-hydroxy-3-methylbut-2-enyl diphosphate reductase [Dehalococcoidales bacterium]
QKLPDKIGIISQTTQIPERFIHFVKEMVDLTLNENAELRIIDTICRDVRQRQAASVELAGQVDLMLVVGGHSSANTRRLAEICSSITETHLIGTAGEIKPEWLEGKKTVGVTSGTSTPDFTVDEVIRRLEEVTGTDR